MFVACTKLMTVDNKKKFPDCISKLLMDFFESEAENGIPGAFNNLGCLSENGKLGYKDVEKAIECYKKAIDMGDIFAIYNMGDLYYNGKNIAKDYNKARKYYELGKKHGSAYCVCMIGDMYKYGRAFEKDRYKANLYYKYAFGLPVEEARTYQELGQLYKSMDDIYYEGIGEAKDYDLAIDLYEKAIDYFVKYSSSGDHTYINRIEVQNFCL